MAPTSVQADLSHQSLMRIEWLTFSGKPDEDVSLFIQAVIRFALSVDRERDGVWIATYAYGCLKDEALKWYYTLDSDVTANWSTLREQLIAKFGTPAPAKTTSQCRIRIIRKNDTQIGYVGYFGPNSEPRFQKSALGALVVDVPLTPQQAIPLSYNMLPGDGRGSFPFVGIEQVKGWWSFRAVALGQATEVRTKAVFSDSANPVASANVWSLTKTEDSTEELTLQWTDDNGTTSPLVVTTYGGYIDSEDSEKTFWMRTHLQGSSEEALKLVLERL